MNRYTLPTLSLCLLITSPSIYAFEAKPELKKEQTGKSHNNDQDKTVLKYNKRALFTEKDEQGRYGVLWYDEKMTEINREFEKLDSDLQKRRRVLQQALQEEGNNPQVSPAHMAKLAKEQNALQIDAEFLQKEYAARVAKLQAEFEDKIKDVVDELREKLGVGGIEAADFKSSSFHDSLDVTKAVKKELNDQYRAEQRAKKFGSETTKSETNKSEISPKKS